MGSWAIRSKVSSLVLTAESFSNDFLLAVGLKLRIGFSPPATLSISSDVGGTLESEAFFLEKATGLGGLGAKG